MHSRTDVFRLLQNAEMTLPGSDSSCYTFTYYSSEVAKCLQIENSYRQAANLCTSLHWVELGMSKIKTLLHGIAISRKPRESFLVTFLVGLYTKWL
jgi:hypothetical protein